MGPNDTRLSLTTSRPGTLDIGVVLRLWDSIYLALSNPATFISYLRQSRAIYLDGTVNIGKILTTCLITMVGCGIISSLLRRRGSASSSERRRFRRSLRRDRSRGSAGTVTSSEEEEDDYDSSGSLRRGTEGPRSQSQKTSQQVDGSSDAGDIDPGLLKKHSSYVSYSTSQAEYPSIRTFYRPHPQMVKFPNKPSPIPLLVFVHGLGGSLAQFNHLLTSLSNVGSCFGIDMPGCGLSSFAPKSWDAYSIEALAELLATAIDQHRDKDAGQEVVLIGHSLGSSLSAMLASSTSLVGGNLKEHILALVAVCPRGSPPSFKEVSSFRRLLNVPGPIFDLWRSWDKRGGLHSNSVNRLVGSDADTDTRGLQVRYNKQSKTPVWRRMALGALPSYENANSPPVGGIPGETVWAGVHMPVLLVAGESDSLTKPEELQKILRFFGEADPSTTRDSYAAGASPEAKISTEPESTENDPENCFGYADRGKRSVKAVILPTPASHALLYDNRTYRTLAGIIQDFLSQRVDRRLNLGWQLQYLNTSGKWDVKNLAKWKKVTPVSEPMANTFVALKMLREVDEEHNPILFSEKYRDRIHAVIDISHDSPVYNPNSLEKGGIHYHKYPTVSKIPPTPDEVRDFIALVDRLQSEITEKLEKAGDPKGPRPVIGVHCHYGFNRTGFLVVSYLIERCGFGVQEAIDQFERQRSPGIRHAHFIDTLFVRYCVGLKRAPTL